MLELISEVCPHLIEEHSADERLDLCCSIRQLAEAKAQFQTLSGIVGRCPTCIGNFKRLFCDLACHPGLSNNHFFSIESQSGVVSEGFSKKTFTAGIKEE